MVSGKGFIKRFEGESSIFALSPSAGLGLDGAKEYSVASPPAQIDQRHLSLAATKTGPIYTIYSHPSLTKKGRIYFDFYIFNHETALPEDTLDQFEMHAFSLLI